MKSNDTFTSNCRHCRFYSPEGRRGGHCSQLNVSVQSTWKACSLATPIFEPEWEFSGIPVWHSETSFARHASATYVVETVEANSEVSLKSL
ncbi:hypothetical protein IQ250_23790 [Pseudanabaenaceae cyanobacterium LEGE 13415]|nr:hypothetical protein [Pseudanabaenaceae cyanobacterium LEGE 13415]